MKLGRKSFIIGTSVVGAGLLVGVLRLGASREPLLNVEGDLRVAVVIAQDGIHQLALSADGRYLAAALDRGGYVVWDARTGVKLHELGSDYWGHLFGSLAFSPDAKHLIVRTSDSVRLNGQATTFGLWDVETGNVDGYLMGPAPARAYAVGDRAGRLVVLYRDSRVVLYDTRTWSEVASWQASRFATNGALAIDPEGHWVALGGQIDSLVYEGKPRGRIWIHESETGRVTQEIEGAHAAETKFVTPVEGGKGLASTSDQLARVVNATNGQLEFLREDDPLRIWDVRTGEKRRSFLASLGGMYALVSAAQRDVVVVSAGGRTRAEPSGFWAWDAASGAAIGSITSNGSFFPAAAIDGNGRTVAVAHARDQARPFEILIVSIE